MEGETLLQRIPEMNGTCGSKAKRLSSCWYSVNVDVQIIFNYRNIQLAPWVFAISRSKVGHDFNLEPNPGILGIKYSHSEILCPNRRG